MGMYTEIIFGAWLKEDLPQDVVDTINILVNSNINDIRNFCQLSSVPDHPFFKSERPWLLQSGGSYYFPQVMRAEFKYDKIAKQYSLCFRTNIKNYDDEIEKFLDWIKPYIESGSGEKDFYAIVCYEENSEPDIYYLRD